MNQSKQQFKINTRLKEIYPPDLIDDKYEPLYEELRTKFKSVYNGQEPSLFIKVPYTITLFGDQITKLFAESVSSNINSDLILCISTSSTLELSVNFFDNAGSPITTPIEQSLTYKSEKDSTIIDYITLGYLTALKYIKTKSQPKAAKVLVMFNTSNIEEKDVQLSSFLGMMIASLCLNTSLPSIEEVYKMSLLELAKICNMSSYSSHIYHKLFLKKQSIGSNISTGFAQIEIDKALSCLIFDSLSAVPISFYSTANYWNKRIIEVRLGIALLYKRFKDVITIDEISLYCKDIKEFIKLFDNNIQTIFEMLEIYLKKTPYTIKELKDELGFDLKLILGDIEFFENVLMTKGFHLYKRLLFVFTEYREIVKLHYLIDTKEKINWIETLNGSCSNMKANYHCFSDEITALLDLLMKKYPRVGFKLISKGWSGNCIALGNSDDIKKLESEIIEMYEKKNEDNQDNLITAWISDDINRYCYITPLGNSLSILNPKYEDFMLEFVDKKINTAEMTETNQQMDETNTTINSNKTD